ncbi:MAG: VanW family protein [Christensenellaceae bacterium]
MKSRIATSKRIPVLAGILCFLCCFFCAGADRVRTERNVTIDGVQVGRLLYADAEEKVRIRYRENAPRIFVESPQGEYLLAYPEISFEDDLFRLVREAKRGETLSGNVRYRVNDLPSFLDRIECDGGKKPLDAQVSYSSKGFSYSAEQNGASLDREKLISDLTKALEEGGERRVSLSWLPVRPSVTMETVKSRTRELADFSTRYDKTAEGRAQNIALAAKLLGGRTILPGEEFSFNRAVGKRTAERGFREAKVIVQGEYVTGVGGGVCQVSTTLYNCALLAGMRVTESKAHSLAVGYVAPSFDAMVSSSSDLKFVNPYAYPVYLECTAQEGIVRVRLFGAPSGKRFERESVVRRVIPCPSPQIVIGQEEKVLRQGKDGLVSESYLKIYEGDKLIERRKLRTDFYAPIAGIEQIVSKNG